MRALVVIAALALAPAAAFADSEAEATAERGFAAYDRGDYAAAISYFEQAYESAPTPGLLFNIAQSYRKLGATGCERALEYYRRYREALTDSGKPVAEGLEARIVEMEACVESAAASDSGDQPVADEPQVQVDATGADRAQPGSSRRLAGWILLGGAAAAVAIAAVTGKMALDRHSDLSSSCPDDVCAPALQGRVTNYNRLRYTAFASGAVGVAALAVGGYLLLSSKRSESAAGVAVQPVIGAGSIGVRCEF